MKHLPRKPSRLIRLSLKDLAAHEADPRYKIEMGDWHTPCRFTRTCSVCLAGAVMARLGVTPTQLRNPIDLGVNENKLYAINSLRVGQIEDALEYLQIKRPKGLARRVKIPGYDEGRGGFFRGLNRLAKRLEAVGL